MPDAGKHALGRMNETAAITAKRAYEPPLGGAPQKQTFVRYYLSAVTRVEKPCSRFERQAALWCCCALLLAAIALFSRYALPSTAHAESDSEHLSHAADVSSKLPGIRLLRTLVLPNEIPTSGMFQSGNSGLTWSRDGERLAAYVRNGLSIAVWSPDGKVMREIPRHNSFGLDSYVLAFLSGHTQLIASPAAPTSNRDDTDAIKDKSISVVDAESGRILRSITGPKPGENAPSNIAIEMAVSPDERFVALVHQSFASLSVKIYETADWHLVTAIDLGDEQLSQQAQGLAFSPDGKVLAILHGPRGRVKLFDVKSWKLLRSFETFSEPPPPKDVALADALAFSPDGMFLAVATHGGGSWWKYPDGTNAPDGRGVLTTNFPAKPLRIFRVKDGELFASLGSFPGGIDRTAALAWSPQGDLLAFLDGVGDIRFWDPMHHGASIVVASIGRHSKTLLFSNDGDHLVANFEGGVKLFDIVSP
jgi:WD40 repeat protein